MIDQQRVSIEDQLQRLYQQREGTPPELAKRLPALNTEIARLEALLAPRALPVLRVAKPMPATRPAFSLVPGWFLTAMVIIAAPLTLLLLLAQRNSAMRPSSSSARGGGTAEPRPSAERPLEIREWLPK